MNSHTKNGECNNDESQNQDFKKLLDLTALIDNPQLRNYVINFLTLKAPDYFKHIPASSSGKFHPQYALGEGGLIRHTIAAVYFTDIISKLQYLKFTQKERDQMIAAIFLHDTFKQGLNSDGAGHTTEDHAKLAAEQIEDPEVSRLVLAHMGQWGYNRPGDTKQFVVHLADYLASRKPVDIKFDLI